MKRKSLLKYHERMHQIFGVMADKAKAVARAATQKAAPSVDDIKTPLPKITKNEFIFEVYNLVLHKDTHKDFSYAEVLERLRTIVREQEVLEEIVEFMNEKLS